MSCVVVVRTRFCSVVFLTAVISLLGLPTRRTHNCQLRTRVTEDRSTHVHLPFRSLILPDHSHELSVHDGLTFQKKMRTGMSSIGAVFFGMADYVDDFDSEAEQNLDTASCDHKKKPDFPDVEVAEIKKSPSHAQYCHVAPLIISSSFLTSHSWSPVAKTSLLQLHRDFEELSMKLRNVFEQNLKREPHPYKGKRSTKAFTAYRKLGIESRQSEPMSQNFAFGRRWPEDTPYHPRPRSISPTASRSFDIELMEANRTGRSMSTPKLNLRSASPAGDGVSRQLVKSFTLAPSPRDLTEKLNISKPVMKHLVVNPRHHTHIYTGMHPDAVANKKNGSFAEEWNVTLKKEVEAINFQIRKSASRPTSATITPQLSNLPSPMGTTRSSHLNLTPDAAKERAKKLRSDALKKVEVILDTSQRRTNGCGFGAKSMVASPEACKKAMWNNPKSSTFDLTPRVKEHVEAIKRRDTENKAQEKARAECSAKAKKDLENKDKIQFTTQYDFDEVDAPKSKVSRSPKRSSFSSSPDRSPSAAATILVGETINSASPSRSMKGSPSKTRSPSKVHGEELLLPGWEQNQTSDGRVFYAHLESGKTQWTKPVKKKMFSPGLTKKFFGTEFWTDEPNPQVLGELLTNDLSEVLERAEHLESSSQDDRLTQLAGSGCVLKHHFSFFCSFSLIQTGTTPII